MMLARLGNLATLILVSWTVVSLQQNQDEYAFRAAADYLRRYIDPTVEPCERFYDHVCSNYTKETDELYEDAFVAKLKFLSDNMLRMLDEIRPNESTPRYKKALKVFFDQCMSLNATGDWTAQIYRAFRERFGGVSLFEQTTTTTTTDETEMDKWELLGSLQSLLDSGVLMEARPIPVPGCNVGSVSETLVFEQAALLRGFAFDATASRRVLSQLADELDVRRTDSFESSLETLLADVERLWNDSQLCSFTDQRLTTLSQLTANSSDYDPSAFLRGLFQSREILRQFYQNSTRTVFADIGSMTVLGELLGRHSADTIKTLGLIRALINAKEDHFDQISFDSDRAQLHFTPNNRRERCVEYTLQYMSPAAAKAYFDFIRADISTWRAEIQLMMRNIFTAFRLLLNSVDWLDAEDKEKVQRKIDQIKVDPGLPSWINDENVVMSRVAEYDERLTPFENEYRTKAKLFRATMRAMAYEESKSEANPKFMVNAFYNGWRNDITICLGLTLPPTFNSSYPLPVKYGGLGWVVSHELIHSVDNAGIQRGGSSTNPSDWIKPEALRRFAQSANCLKRQYSRYCFKDLRKCVHGERTVSENIADIGGLKVAYTAYKIVSQMLGNQSRLPDVLDYNDDQLFFVSAASVYCGKGAPTDMYWKGAHSPNSARVDISMKNVPMFAESFGCVVGSKYGPTRRCNIWGQLFHPCSKDNLDLK